MKKGDEAAYPQTSGHVFKTGDMEDEKIYTVGGLTKREHFACEAMKGFISSSESLPSKIIRGESEMILRASVIMADGLIKEFEK